MSKTLQFTGEFFVPDAANARMEADHLERYRFAAQHAQGKHVLDIACGAGYSAPLYAEAGAASYLGVDLNSELVQSASANYAGKNAEFRVGDITKFECGMQFDLISCFETIEHVPDFHGAIANLFKLLKPGGMLLVSSPNRPVTSPSAASLSDKPENPFHTQEFTPDELADQLTEAGFEVTNTDTFGQRQSNMPSAAFLRFLYKAAFGNPKKKASPEVAPLASRTPRYFLIRARKPE